MDAALERQTQELTVFTALVMRNTTIYSRRTCVSRRTARLSAMQCHHLELGIWKDTACVRAGQQADEPAITEITYSL